MIVDKHLVYANADMACRTKLDMLQREFVSYRNLARLYFEDPETFTSLDHGLTINEIWEARAHAESEFRMLYYSRVSVKQTVDNLLADIQNRMSQPDLTNLGLHRISLRICTFMHQSGLDWPSGDGPFHMKLRRFLQHTWGLYKIPENLEEAWAIIPEIGRDFKVAMDAGYDFRQIGTDLQTTQDLRICQNKCRQFQCEDECVNG
jgi:hypothetical protein